MKAKINGIEVEGTPGEIQVILGIKSRNAEPKYAEAPEKRYRKVGQATSINRGHWTRAEIKILKASRDERGRVDVSAVHKQLPDRTMKAIVSFCGRNRLSAKNWRNGYVDTRSKETLGDSVQDKDNNKIGGRGKSWNQQEKNLLMHEYVNKGVVDISVMTNQMNRGRFSIQKKCSQLRIPTTGLKRVMGQARGTLPKTEAKTRPKRILQRQWSKKEDGILLGFNKNGIVDARKVHNKLPHRSLGAIKARIITNYGLRCTESGTKRLDKVRAEPSTASQIERRKRSQFIFHKANKYMKEYNWSREKAFSYAATEWNSKRGKTRIEMKTFPDFNMIDDSSIAILKDIITDAINQKRAVTFNAASQMLMLKSHNDWTSQAWTLFLHEFAKNTKRISEYYDVPNKFAIDNGVIVYKG